MNENSWQHWRMTYCGVVVGNESSSFHEWKFMATLKVIWPYPRGMPSYSFPWMKIHGNIEGSFTATLSSMPSICFHEWKFMATLKVDIFPSLYACLITVSMNENSWQHWRMTAVCIPVELNVGFHEWKFMATLKGVIGDSCRLGIEKFPWMKIHGNIEGCGFASQCRSTRLCFHEWRFMATLNVHEIRPTWGSI